MEQFGSHGISEAQQQVADLVAATGGFSVSEGTLLADDLISAFEAFLDFIGVSWPLPSIGEEDDDYLNETLWYLMEEIAPYGWYFGAHPGDGSDFGYWEAEDTAFTVVEFKAKL